MANEATIYVISVDPQSRQAVCDLVSSMHLNSIGYTTAEDFLDASVDNSTGVLVTGLLMPGMSGLDLLSRLYEMGSPLVAIVLTAHATTSTTVQAIQLGALTVLDKPCEDCELWTAIRHGLDLNAHRRRSAAQTKAVRARLESLSPSERDVMDMVVLGKANKVIAQALDLSIRTVENRRRDIYQKLNVDSAVELVRMVLEVESDRGREGFSLAAWL